MDFFHINTGRWDEAGRWDRFFIYPQSNFVPLVSTKAGSWDDSLPILLEGWIESACKHSTILS